jgi:serine protease Do
VGIGVQALTDAIRTSLSFTQSGGVLVAQIAPASPADIAGVRVGDIVSAVNGVAVASPTDFVAKIGVWAAVQRCVPATRTAIRAAAAAY